jgi:hypothetical protein
MAGRGGMEWLIQRRGFLAGIAVGLAVTLGVIGLVYSTSSSGTKNTADTSTPAASTPAGADTSAPSAAASAPVPAGTATVAVPQIAVAAPSLDGWKLTLPVDKAGSLSGKAEQLSAAAATAPWLTRNADGSLSFWAPATGATTSNSEHARTELVSTNDFTLGTGVHSLAATLSVTQVPSSDPDIDVGQIHGGGSLKSIPFVMLHWRDGNIVVIVKQVMHGSTSQSVTLLTGVPLGARFSYVMTDAGNGTLTLTASYNGQANQATVQVATPFMGTDERFQVGDYQQATAGSSASDGGRVTFYAIHVS